MKKFYYIVYRKPRNFSKRYVGDGLWSAPTKTQARKEIAQAYGAPVNLIKLEDRA